MAKCPIHGWTSLAGAGAGRNKYTFCFLCRTLRAVEAVSPGETAKANGFLKEQAEALKPEKSVSVRATAVADLYKSTEESRLSRREVVAGAAEDELLSCFGNMADRWDTDRLKDAILGILEGPVRAAASKYGLDKDMVFDVRLLIASEGVEAGVEKLLNYVKKRQRKADLAAQKLAA